MKRFTVVWHQWAETRLMEIWLAAQDRAAIRTAADQVDRELAMRPVECGDYVDVDIYELHSPPLTVLYLVLEPDRTVQVVGVRVSSPP